MTESRPENSDERVRGEAGLSEKFSLKFLTEKLGTLERESSQYGARVAYVCVIWLQAVNQE